MSPEQAMAEKVDFRSDLYALGCMLHEMLTGGPVFQAEDKVSLLLKHVTGEPPPLPERLAGDEALPRALGVLHEALLAKMRDKRPADCRVVADICEAVEQGREVDAQAMLIEARTRGMSDAALAETIGPPPEATVSMGPAAKEPATAEPSTPTGEPSTVVTPGTPGPAVVPLSARATAPAELQEGARVETTDGNPSVGMGSADLAALRRAAQGPFRSRAWLGVLAVLAVGAAVVGGFVVARPDESPRVKAEAVGARIEAPVEEPERAVADEAAAPEAPESPPVPSEPEKAAPAATPQVEVPERREARSLSTAESAAPAVPPASEKVEPPPKPVPAHVVIRSRPTGATVRRGDKELCRTPCELSLPPEAEPVRLRLERRGRKAADVVLRLVPGGDILRDVVLEPMPARRRTTRVKPKAAETGELPGIRPTGAAGTETKPKPAEPLPGIRMTR